MVKVRDGFFRQVASLVGSDSYLLKAGGGYIGVGNASGNVPLSNGTVNANLNADLLDGKHYNDIISDTDNKYVKKTGDTMTGTLKIDIDSATSHIAFTRASYNYITAATAGGMINFITNGLSITSANSTLILSGKNGYPGTTNVGTWGSSSNRWSNVYSVLGNFSGQITSTVATGTAPLKVTSTTIVTNLNADMLDGKHASDLIVSLDYLNVMDIRATDLTPAETDQKKVTAWFNNTGTPTSTWYSGITVHGWSNTYAVWQLAGTSTTSASNKSLYFRSGVNDTWNDWREVLFTDSTINATKLATKRTLWGQSFDGSANVSGDMTGVGSINNVIGSLTGTSNARLYIETITSGSPSDYIHMYVDGGSNANRNLILQSGHGSVVIGTHSGTPAGKLHVVGDIYSTGQLISNIATGTSPLKVTSTTAVTNLNADLLDGKHYSDIITDTDNKYVKKAGDTMTGTLTMPTPSSAIAQGIRFGTVAHIGASSSLYLYSTGSICLRPGQDSVSTADSTKGITLTATSLYSAATNTVSNGTSSYRWSNTYSVLGNFSGQVTLSVATGTAPLKVTSTTLVSNLNADKLDNYEAIQLAPRVAYAYANGCLVKLKIASTKNAMILVHIRGNTYSTSASVYPINTIVQFYNYNTNDQITRPAGMHFGYAFGNISAFAYDGYVYVWFKQSSSSQTLVVEAYSSSTTTAEMYNCIDTITNAAMPTEGVTRLVEITPVSSNQTFYKLTFAAGKFTAGDYTPNVAAKTINIPTKVSDLTDAANYVTTNTAQTISAKKTFSVQQAFTVATGTSPFTVTSTTAVTNLNADMLDGKHASDFLTEHQSLDNYVTLGTAQTISGIKTFSVQQKFTVADGTAPFTVTSKTAVTNLNADMLDGKHASDFLTSHQSLANYVTLNTAQTISAKKTFSVQQAFTVADGTAPFTVTSKTAVTNLNADMLDGIHSSGFAKKGNATTGQNIDEITSEAGFLSVTSNSHAVVDNGFPVAQAGLLIYGTGAYSGTLQIYGTYSSNKWYARGGGKSGDSTYHTAWREFLFTDSSISATKLTTARTLWGQSFDGSANVSGNMSSVGNISGNYFYVSNSSTNPYYRLTLNDNNWYVQALTNYLYVGPTSSKALRIDQSGNTYIPGNTGIGVSSPSYKLHVSGDIYSTGQLISNAATGTAPLKVTSTTYVPNLNADMLDGKHYSDIITETNSKYVLKEGDTMTGPLYVPMVIGQVTWDDGTGGSYWGINPVGGANFRWVNVEDEGLFGSLTVYGDSRIYGRTTIHDYLYAESTSYFKNKIICSVQDGPAIQVASSNPAMCFGLNADMVDGKHYDDIIKDTDAKYVTLTTAQTISGVKTFSKQQKFTVATGTAPFTVTSTTYVPNLNADMLDGKHASDFLTSDSTISATQLKTARKLWGQSFNGTADVSGDMTDVGSINNVIGEIKNYSSAATRLKISSSYLPNGSSRYNYIHFDTDNPDDHIYFKIGSGHVGINVSPPMSSNYSLVVGGGGIYSQSFHHSVDSDNYVILAGGGVKLLSEIGGGTSGDYVTTNTAQNITAKKTFTSAPAFNVTVGSPFTVTQTVKVTNLNADRVDDLHFVVTTSPGTDSSTIYIIT